MQAMIDPALQAYLDTPVHEREFKPVENPEHYIQLGAAIMAYGGYVDMQGIRVQSVARLLGYSNPIPAEVWQGIMEALLDAQGDYGDRIHTAVDIANRVISLKKED